MIWLFLHETPGIYIGRHLSTMYRSIVTAAVKPSRPSLLNYTYIVCLWHIDCRMVTDTDSCCTGITSLLCFGHEYGSMPVTSHSPGTSSRPVPSHPNIHIVYSVFVLRNLSMDGPVLHLMQWPHYHSTVGNYRRCIDKQFQLPCRGPWGGLGDRGGGRMGRHSQSWGRQERTDAVRVRTVLSARVDTTSARSYKQIPIVMEQSVKVPVESLLLQGCPCRRSSPCLMDIHFRDMT